MNELTEQYAFIEKFTIYTADMCCCSFARSYGENEAEAEFNTRYGRKWGGSEKAAERERERQQ